MTLCVYIIGCLSYFYNFGLSGTNQFAFQIKYIYVFTNSFPTCNRLSVRVKIVTVFVNGFPFIFQFITLFVVINIFLSFFYKTFLSSRCCRRLNWNCSHSWSCSHLWGNFRSLGRYAYSHNTDCYNCQKFAYLSHTLSLPINQSLVISPSDGKPSPKGLLLS